MILTCPDCATSYFVDDARIPPGGRTVKCTSCGARWRAALEAEPALEDAELFEAEAAPAPTPVAATAEDDLEVSGPEPTPKPRPTPAARPKTLPVGPILAWSAMAATVAAVIVGALVFRDQIVRLAPQTSGAYAELGVPVNSLGLVIEDVKAEPAFEAGRPVLAVTGAIRNLRQSPGQSPAIRIDMLSRTGRRLAAKIVRPIDPAIPAGSTRHFAVVLSEPPASVHDLTLAFDIPGAAHKASAAVHAEAAAPADGHSPPPVDAQPLPADAPDALSDHHG
jgi:predicted Zn finger-like uncharacterized protein